ncbi:MAG: Lrp/AsnC family transcriptional regulator [Candidatus Omnitrophica bacterium]|nr:Lrp/AsnC family transcriptional regulator [Candidatus Omnitrophota bacterium]
MTSTLKKTVLGLTAPLALVPEPYAAVAAGLGISQTSLFSRIKKYKSAGIVRRVGVVLGHYKAGYKSNALVMWQVAEPKLAFVGKVMAKFPQVTHCYARKTYPGWSYNLYTMVHDRHKTELLQTIQAMSVRSKVKVYKIQSTVQEFKKIKSDLQEILA